MNQRIGLGQRPLFSRSTHRFRREPACTSGATERPEHQGKKSHDHERQIQRRSPEGRGIRFSTMDRQRLLEMRSRIQVIAPEPAGDAARPMGDDGGHRRVRSPVSRAPDGIRQLPHRSELAVCQAGIEEP